jgi:hypothetical protein
MNPIAAAVGRSNKMAILLATRVIEGNMTSTIRLTRQDPESIKWNPETNKIDAGDQDVIWEPNPDAGPDDPPRGIATIKTVSGPVTMTLGDEPQYFSSTFISIPMRARTPQANDIAEILTCPDEKLVGRFYRIVDVELGGQLPVVHRMQAVGIQPGPYWRRDT